jgi:hypothetical protein
MKTKWTTLLAAGALSLVLAIPSLTLGQAAQSAPGGQQATKPAKKSGEQHPEIREAMGQLRHAKETLAKDAARDFEGHRKAAIGHINQALEELQKALQSDKK